MVHLFVAIPGAHLAPDLLLAAVAVIRLQIQEQIVDVPVPQIKEEIVEIVAGEVVCNARTGVRRQHGWTCPRSPEQNVEVI